MKWNALCVIPSVLRHPSHRRWHSLIALGLPYWSWLLATPALPPYSYPSWGTRPDCWRRPMHQSGSPKTEHLPHRPSARLQTSTHSHAPCRTFNRFFMLAYTAHTQAPTSKSGPARSWSEHPRSLLGAGQSMMGLNMREAHGLVVDRTFSQRCQVRAVPRWRRASDGVMA